MTLRNTITLAYYLASQGVSAQRMAEACETLTACEKALASLGVADCNVGLTPRQEKRRERLADAAMAAGASLGAMVETHRDPRGPAVLLTWKDPAAPSNCFGGGWAFC